MAGQTGPIDGQAMLKVLEQINLFIFPWTAKDAGILPPLFADVLSRRLEQLFRIGFPTCTAGHLAGYDA